MCALTRSSQRRCVLASMTGARCCCIGCGSRSVVVNGAAREALKSLIKRDFPTGVDFIVVDTLGQASPGQDLNSPAFGSALTEATKELREEFKCCIIVVHHLGKDPRRGALGSVMIISDPGTVAEFRKVKGRSDMREEYIHHVREGEADRSIGYKIVTAANLHGTPSPVPVPVSELELKTAKLKAKREKNKTQDRLRVEAEIMRDILIERGCTTNLNGLPSLGLAQCLWDQARLAGKSHESLTPEQHAQREGEIKAIADRIGKAAKRHMTECKGAYYGLCGYGPSKEIRWFVPKEAIDALLSDHENSDGESDMEDVY
jgi:hypothetical protein